MVLDLSTVCRRPMMMRDRVFGGAATKEEGRRVRIAMNSILSIFPSHGPDF
jgi:hypothetical protein